MTEDSGPAILAQLQVLTTWAQFFAVLGCACLFFLIVGALVRGR